MTPGGGMTSWFVAMLLTLFVLHLIDRMLNAKKRGQRISEWAKALATSNGAVALINFVQAYYLMWHGHW